MSRFATCGKSRAAGAPTWRASGWSSARTCCRRSWRRPELRPRSDQVWGPPSGAFLWYAPVMSDRSDAYKPDGWPAVTPRLVTTDVAGLVHFLKVVFDAKGDLHADRPSELRIDDAMVMVS